MSTRRVQIHMIIFRDGVSVKERIHAVNRLIKEAKRANNLLQPTIARAVFSGFVVQ